MTRWPLNKAHFWEEAPFFRLLVPFAAGILCYYTGLINIQGSYMIGASAVALALYVILMRISNTDTLRIISFVIINATLLCAGNACCWYNDVRNDKNWFGHRPDNDACVARIAATPTMTTTEHGYIWKVPVNVLASIHADKTTTVNGSGLVYVYNDSSTRQFNKGDTIIVKGNWERISNAGNPFEFDYAAYCGYNGLYYRKFANIDNIHLYSVGRAADVSLTEKAHEWCMNRFYTYIRDVKAFGLITAMMLGDEVNLDDDMRAAYAETGVIHIIAISGGNVAIFFIIISALLWWMKNKEYLWVKYAIALPLVWFYVMMAGASPSAIRAAVMFSLFAFAIMFQKNNNSLNGIFATAFLLLVAQPAWLFSLGFQLSFAAVLSLIIFYRHIRKWVSPANTIGRLLWDTVAASIAAQVLVAPIIIYYFHSFPPLFLVANVIAYLFMGLVLMLSIAILLLSFIPAVASLIAFCLVYVVDIFDVMIRAIQYFSPASFRVLLLTAAEMLLAYVIIAGISVFLLRKKNLALVLSLGAACVLLGSFITGKLQRIKQEHLVVYNTARDNYIELTRGDVSSQVTKPRSWKADYAMKPAHINWQIRSLKQPTGKRVFSVAGQTVLVLDRAINSNDHFPADVVILNYTGKTDPQQLKRLFSPKVVVVGNNYTQTQQKQLVKVFSNTGILLHAVSISGAYTLH